MARKTIKLIDKGKNLTVETGAEICLAAEDLGYLGKCIFVGQKKDQFIVVTPPSNFSPVEKNLLQANPILVRYQFEGDIYEFTSKVLEIKYEPLTLLLLQYPVAIEKIELRSQKRISCFISAKTEVNNETQDAIIKDISKSGCRCVFETSKKLEIALRIDDHISLSFGFPGIFDEQEILGKIKDIRMEESGLDVGIEFASTAWWVPPYD
jgi:c-di-GMP-binding flagellar brake protein YcgR